MMQIIFANFFYFDYQKNNIFAEYLNQIKPHLDNNYDKMADIFSDRRGNNFFHTGKHYFKNLHKPGGKPKVLWKKLYDIAFKDMQRKKIVKIDTTTDISNKTQENIAEQAKPLFDKLKPDVLAAKEKALAWRDRLRSRKKSPKIKLNITRRIGETPNHYEKRKALIYAKEMFGKK